MKNIQGSVLGPRQTIKHSGVILPSSTIKLCLWEAKKEINKKFVVAKLEGIVFFSNKTEIRPFLSELWTLRRFLFQRPGPTKKWNKTLLTQMSLDFDQSEIGFNGLNYSLAFFPLMKKLKDSRVNFWLTLVLSIKIRKMLSIKHYNEVSLIKYNKTGAVVVANWLERWSHNL